MTEKQTLVVPGTSCYCCDFNNETFKLKSNIRIQKIKFASLFLFFQNSLREKISPACYVFDSNFL